MDKSALQRPLNETLDWAIPASVRDSLDLDHQVKYVAFSKPLPNLQPTAKVIATGELNWNVYTDEKAITSNNFSAQASHN